MTRQADLVRRLGVSKQRVSQYVAAGMPIDLEAAEAWVAANVALERRDSWGAPETAEAQRVAGPTDAASDAPKRPGGVRKLGKRQPAAKTLNELRREREEVRVARERIELRKAQSELVEREDVRRFLAARAKLERDSWVAWSSRAAVEIAAATGADVATIFPALEREVREQLRQLADTPLPEIER